MSGSTQQSQKGTGAKQGIPLHHEDIFYDAEKSTRIKGSAIFVVDLSKEAALVETSKPKTTTVSLSHSTSSLPVYDSLLHFFIQDAPPSYTAATGKKLESTELEVSVKNKHF